jgi:hypothetical protein
MSKEKNPFRLVGGSDTTRLAIRAERDAITFEAIDLPFPGTNEDWALGHLPTFRVALLLLSSDPEKLKSVWAEFVEADEASELLESLCIVKQKFEDMSHFMDVAITRSVAVLERLGYGSDNPPSDEDNQTKGDVA